MFSPHLASIKSQRLSQRLSPTSAPHQRWRYASLGAALTLSACGSGDWTINVKGRDKVIVVPSSASIQPAYPGDGSPPPRRYVVRMSDGTLDWEVELPEVATGYELRIPFKKDKPGDPQRGGVSFGSTEGLTSADKELIAAMRRRNLGTESEGLFNEQGEPLDGRPQGQAGADQAKSAAPAPARQSYMKGVQKARELFEARKYELALLALKELDTDYPNDLQIKSMLGTLWLQLNQPDLAREAWEAALKLDPQNKTLIQALKQLTPQGEPSEPSEPTEPQP
jgi:hypothetical protein